MRTRASDATTRFLIAVSALVLGTGEASAKQGKSQAVEQAILKQSNAFRAGENVKPLKADPVLMSVAQKHARNMARQDKYGDTDKNGHVLDGKQPVDRVKAAQYNYAAFAENVAYNVGYEDVASKAMNGWINSPGHRRNLIDKEYTETGVGAAQGRSGRWYFCQVFGRPASLMTRIKAQIDNRTQATIKFQIEDSKYSLEPRVIGTYTHSKSSGDIVYRINWPNGGKPETGVLKNQTRYAFIEENGKLQFRRLGPLE